MLRSILVFMLLAIFIAGCGGKPEPAVRGASAEKVTVAVLYFERNSSMEEMEQYRKGLTDMFISKLQNLSQLQVIERTRLDNLLNEMQLGETGVVDAKTAQKIGRLLGAQLVYYGSFTTLGNIMNLNGHLVRVETGEYESSAESRCEVDPKKIFQMVDKVSNEISAEVKTNYKELVADGFYSKGRTAEESGDKDSAIRYYQQALKYFPDHEMSKEALAKVKL